MKKIGIVSSFSDSCGNAYFSKVLMDSISDRGYQAVALELNLTLTQSMQRCVRKKADQHIEEICDKASKLDAVNIQLEAGLYGSIPSDIYRRIKKLTSSNSNVSVTLHSPRLIGDASPQRQVIKHLLRLRVITAMRCYFQDFASSINMRLNKRLISLFVNRKIPLITHTLRAKSQISIMFSYENISTHPLKLVPSNFSVNHDVMEGVKQEIGAVEGDVFIGMFGFINEYKGHSLAIEALKYLPRNHRLLIFGRQHPQTLKSNQLCDTYLQRLQDQIVRSKLRNRVLFMGEYDTPAFMNLAASVDVIWLPYVENGQDGSGIASICLDVSTSVLCSASLAFDELFRLEKHDSVRRFDIGNALELATKTKMCLKSSRKTSDAKTQFSVETQAEAYINALGV